MLSGRLTVYVETERLYHSHWLKVFVPYPVKAPCIVSCFTTQGELLKKASLSTGTNSIDISSIGGSLGYVKVETHLETVYQEIKKGS